MEVGGGLTVTLAVRRNIRKEWKAADLAGNRKPNTLKVDFCWEKGVKTKALTLTPQTLPQGTPRIRWTSR